jgi:hypothetical protein
MEPARGGIVLKSLPAILALSGVFTLIRAIDPNRQHVRLIALGALSLAIIGLFLAFGYRRKLRGYETGLYMGLGGLAAYGVIVILVPA